MSQPHQPQQQQRQSLRDTLGLALGVITALIFTLRVHEHTVSLFWSQLAPLMPWGNYAFWSGIWAMCVFFLLMSATRYGFALLVTSIMSLFTLLIVRLSLPRHRRK